MIFLIAPSASRRRSGRLPDIASALFASAGRNLCEVTRRLIAHCHAIGTRTLNYPISVCSFIYFLRRRSSNSARSAWVAEQQNLST
jgi:hypothetical protein